MLNRITILILVFLMPTLSLAGVEENPEIKGFVLNVSKDCLLIVSIDNEGATIRLAGIAYLEAENGDLKNAREFVSSMAMSKTVRIECLGRDRSGILLGRVHIGNLCLNNALIQVGLAQPEPSIIAMP